MLKKISVFYPLFLGGGAEAVTAWMLHVLKDHYDLTLFTFSVIDFKQVDQQFGTKLDGAGITLNLQYRNLFHVRLMQGYSLMTFRQHLLSRVARRLNNKYDLTIAAFNEMDLGGEGLQYIHIPLFGHGNELARKILDYPTSLIRTLYQRSCELLFGYSNDRMKKNRTITNSQWTSDLIYKSYGIRAEVLYPPIVLDVPVIPWNKREFGFVCSGRISPDKNLETVIEIIRRIRELGYDIHLHLLSGGFDSKYRNLIQKLQNKHSHWLFIDENLSRNDLLQMLTMHRYGIHGRARETFGISIAEMVKAGCIPFVPKGGGPEEIVGSDTILIFEETEDAVQKIVKVLSNQELEDHLRVTLEAIRQRFSIDRFRTNFLQIVQGSIK